MCDDHVSVPGLTAQFFAGNHSWFFWSRWRCPRSCSGAGYVFHNSLAGIVANGLVDGSVLLPTAASAAMIASLRAGFIRTNVFGHLDAVFLSTCPE